MDECCLVARYCCAMAWLGFSARVRVRVRVRVRARARAFLGKG